MSDREDNEAFCADTTGADCSTCYLNTDFCLECIAMRKAAWEAAITECQAICGNQYDFLVEAMERMK